MLGLLKIPSAPGYFSEPATGRIFSNRRGKLRPLKGGNSRGYKIHSLMIDGKQVTRSAHRLVCESVWGLCPPGMECCHVNGNRSDNRAINLRWASPSQNNGADKMAHNRLPLGEKHHNTFLKSKDVLEIRLQRSQGKSCRDIGRNFGVSASTVSKIARRVHWGHV